MSKHKPKLILLSDSILATTGNAKVAKALLKGLQKLGYEAINMAIAADEPEWIIEGIKILPIAQHGFDDNSVAVFMNKLTKYLEREKPDYFVVLGDRIHYQQLGLGNIEKEFIKKIGTKMIFWETVDSDVKLCMESSLKRQDRPRRDIYKTFDHIVTTSKFGKEVLEREFTKVDKVIWEFADTERFTPVSDKQKIEIRKQYRFRKDDFIFLTIGRCMRRKNPELVIEAIYPLLIEYPNARLFCVIPDYYKKDDQHLPDFCQRVMPLRYGGRDLIDERKIIFCKVDGKSLSLATGIKDDEVVKFYQLSDAVISGSSNEGFNLVFGETCSVGLPYIGINNTTIPELTNNGEVGFIAEGSIKHHPGQSMLVTSTSIKELREQIRKVLDLTKEERDKLKETNRKFIEERLSKVKMCHEWNKYLKSITDDGGKK